MRIDIKILLKLNKFAVFSERRIILNILIDRETAKRFLENLPEYPRWGTDKRAEKPIHKFEALKHGNYIQLPTQKSNYIAIDIDYAEAGAAWIVEGLPCPTIIIVNPNNGHAHYLYELRNPVYFPLLNPTIKISWKSINYFRAVQKGLSKTLAADLGFTGYLIKNPFSPNWCTFWHKFQYDLDELSKQIFLPDVYNLRIDENDAIYGRHMTIFHTCRKKAYQLVKECETFDEFYDKIMKLTFNFYEQNIKNITADHPFSENEVKSIAVSISSWTWKHRLDKNFKNMMKNKGAMNLPTTEDLGRKLTPEEIKLRSSEGAKYTHNLKQSKTMDLINKTIIDLKNKNLPVTFNSVWSHSGLSKNTINNYKKFFSL